MNSINKGHLTFVAILVISVSCHADEQTPHAIVPMEIGSIERLHAELDQLVPRGAKIEAIAEGFQWSEGPLWLSVLQCIVFSDVPRNTIFAWSEKDGLSVYLKPSGYTGNTTRPYESGSNGLALDAQGRLLLCQHGDRRLARMDATLEEPKPLFTTLAEQYRGKRLHSPNDLVVHSSGSIFFTDPPYGLAGGWKSPSRELNFEGIYRLDPDGSLNLLIRDITRPNGIGLSPDEKTLYVASSDRAVLNYRAYDLDDRLEPQNERVFFNAKPLSLDRVGSCDGMKIDRHGNLFASGPGGVLILSPTGKHLGTLMPGVPVSNCGFGDDGSTLYLTAQKYLCRVRLKTKGIGF